jgi:hypothetical protein
MNKQWWAKVLRVVSIILMGLTAVFTLMGGDWHNLCGAQSDRFWG